MEGCHKNEFVSVMNGNVLLTSASKKVPLVRALKNAMCKLGCSGKLIVADCKDECLAKYFADDFWLMRPLDEWQEDQLLAELNERRIAAIVPSRDGELTFWSAHKEKLYSRGISVMVSDLTAVKLCLDKLAFYEYCKNKDIPAIQTSKYIFDLNTDYYVVKERYGYGSQNIGINLSLEEAIDYARKLKHPIFQPCVKGIEYSADAYIERNGEIKGIVCRSRDWTYNGESQITTVVHNDGMDQSCLQYIGKMGLYGHVVLQFIVDMQQNIHLLECNARFGGASTLGIAAGLDSFYWFLLETNGLDIATYSFTKTAHVLQQIRAPQDFIINLNNR